MSQTITNLNQKEPRQIQCQKTDLIYEWDGEALVCPGGQSSKGNCSSGELYELLPQQFYDYFRKSITKIQTALGFPKQPVPAELVGGLFPYSTRIHEGLFVYCDTSSDEYAKKIELGHEAFHCVTGVSPTDNSWAREMLAEYFSIKLLRANNSPRAKIAHNAKRKNGKSFDRSGLFSLPFITSDQSETYSGLYILCSELLDAIGMNDLKSLATEPGVNFQPDVNAWLSKLPPVKAAVASGILLSEGS
jgi:hypothetical protein